MLLPQTKEREYRFKLALRMGLPIFALVLALITHTFIDNSSTLYVAFYVESILLLLFSVYFIFYLIYSGFDVKITDDVSKTFSRAYLYEYLKKELKTKEDYTFFLISIDNLSDINSQYGLKNGDKIVRQVAEWIANYFIEQKIKHFPLGRIKGGDFILSIKGKKSQYSTMIDLMCLKSSELKIDDIEVNLSSAIIDTDYSRELDYLIDNLFEIQEENRNFKQEHRDENITPDELESIVINALNKRAIAIMTQNVFEDEKVVFQECFVKLRTMTGKLLYPKKFLKVIKKLGLGVEFDLMVLEELLSHVNSQKSEMYALNISATSLRNEKFLSSTKELLTGSQIKIMFVISEQEYFSHTSRYNSIIHSLKNLGSSVCIDRLGSLHSSFLYLRELDIDYVRYDTYYSNENKFKNNISVIHGLNTIAKDKNIKTWIKNIENNTILELAQSLDIDYVQGKALANLEILYEN